jgi:hypothetical protein
MDLSRPARVGRNLKWLRHVAIDNDGDREPPPFSTSEHGAAGRSGAHFANLEGKR